MLKLFFFFFPQCKIRFPPPMLILLHWTSFTILLFSWSPKYFLQFFQSLVLPPLMIWYHQQTLLLTYLLSQWEMTIYSCLVFCMFINAKMFLTLLLLSFPKSLWCRSLLEFPEGFEKTASEIIIVHKHIDSFRELHLGLLRCSWVGPIYSDGH